jgi:predicted nucleic acid-binding protein
MPGSFLDSNIVLYLASGDLRKADRAQELVAEGGTISVQVWPSDISFRYMTR